MSLTWTGVTAFDKGWGTNHALLLSIAAGHTLVRTHFAWGFQGITSQEQRPDDTWHLYMSWGIVTTVGDGTESPPSAAAPASNVSPPTQRWLHWSTKFPELVKFGDTYEAFLFKESPAAAPDSSEGMVKAANIPDGQTLNVWASWYAPTAWEVLGVASLRYWVRLGVM